MSSSHGDFSCADPSNVSFGLMAETTSPADLRCAHDTIAHCLSETKAVVDRAALRARKGTEECDSERSARVKVALYDTERDAF